MSIESKPLLALTMGDPAGTGPELLAKALAQPEVNGVCRAVVFGDLEVLREAARLAGASVSVRPLNEASAATGRRALFGRWKMRHSILVRSFQQNCSASPSH